MATQGYTLHLDLGSVVLGLGVSVRIKGGGVAFEDVVARLPWSPGSKGSIVHMKMVDSEASSNLSFDVAL